MTTAGPTSALPTNSFYLKSLNYPTTLPPTTWPRHTPTIFVLTSTPIPENHRNPTWHYLTSFEPGTFSSNSSTLPRHHTDIILLLGTGEYDPMTVLQGFKGDRIEIIGMGGVFMGEQREHDRQWLNRHKVKISSWAEEDIFRIQVKEMRLCNLAVHAMNRGCEFHADKIELDECHFVTHEEAYDDSEGLLGSFVQCRGELFARNCAFFSYNNIEINDDSEFENCYFGGNGGQRYEWTDNTYSTTPNIMIKKGVSLKMTDCLFDASNKGHAIELQDGIDLDKQQQQALNELIAKFNPAFMDDDPVGKMMANEKEKSAKETSFEMSGNVILNPTCSVCPSKLNVGICYTRPVLKIKRLSLQLEAVVNELEDNYTLSLGASPEITPYQQKSIDEWNLVFPYPTRSDEEWKSYYETRLALQEKQNLLNYDGARNSSDFLSEEEEYAEEPLKDVVHRARVQFSDSLYYAFQDRKISMQSFHSLPSTIKSRMVTFCYCVRTKYASFPKEILDLIFGHMSKDFDEVYQALDTSVVYTSVWVNWEEWEDPRTIETTFRFYSPHGIHYADFEYKYHSRARSTFIEHFEYLKAKHSEAEDEFEVFAEDDRVKMNHLKQTTCDVETLNRLQRALIDTNLIFSPVKFLELLVISKKIVASNTKSRWALQRFIKVNQDSMKLYPKEQLTDAFTELQWEFDSDDVSMSWDDSSSSEVYGGYGGYGDGGFGGYGGQPQDNECTIS